MVNMKDEFKQLVLKSLIQVLTNRLHQLEDVLKHNGRLHKEIADIKKDLAKYKKMLKELDDDIKS